MGMQTSPLLVLALSIILSPCLFLLSLFSLLVQGCTHLGKRPSLYLLWVPSVSLSEPLKDPYHLTLEMGKHLHHEYLLHQADTHTSCESPNSLNVFHKLESDTG